jgi:hypothetical protein
MAVIDYASMRGSMTLTAETGCSISGTFAFSNWSTNRVSRGGTEVVRFSASFVSDGPTTITHDTSGSGPYHVTGVNGSVTLPSGFNGEVEAFSWSANPELAIYGTFSSASKYAKIKQGNVTGTVEGVMTFDAASTQPIPSV